MEQVNGQKKRKQTGVSWYDKIKVESLCIAKVQTFEKFP